MQDSFYRSLLTIGLRMAQIHELEPLLHYALQSALELVGGTCGHLVLLGADATRELHVALDEQGQILDNPQAQLNQAIVGQTLDGGRPIVQNNRLDKANIEPPDESGAIWCSIMCAPLIIPRQTLGVIYVENRGDSAVFGKHDLESLTQIASQIAVYIERAQLMARLEVVVRQRTSELEQLNVELQASLLREQHLARTDSLTGVTSRAYFFDLADAAFSIALEEQQPLAVMMIDIDYFKRVNDTFGHLVSDAVLRQAAQRTREMLRDSDVIGRYGGEEFVVLLPNTNLQEASRVAESIRRHIASRPFSTEPGAVTLTVSIGLSLIDPRDENIAQSFERADWAMYIAKTAGRNRTMISADGFGSSPVEEVRA